MRTNIEASGRGKKEEIDQKIAEVIRSLPEETSEEDKIRIREKLEEQFSPGEEIGEEGVITIAISGISDKITDNDVVSMVSSVLRTIGEDAFVVGDVLFSRTVPE